MTAARKKRKMKIKFEDLLTDLHEELLKGATSDGMIWTTRRTLKSIANEIVDRHLDDDLTPSPLLGMKTYPRGPDRIGTLSIRQVRDDLAAALVHEWLACMEAISGGQLMFPDKTSN
jgi:hypothetical protein